MTRHTYRIAALVTSGLAATLLLHACGGYSSPTPTNPDPDPQPANSDEVILVLASNGNGSK